MPTRISRIFGVLALLLFVSGLTYAAVNQDSYKITRGSGPELLFDGVTAVTSAAWSAPTNPRYTRGNPSIAIFAASPTGGGTIEVQCGLYHRNEGTETYTFLGVSDAVTITFSTDQEVSAGVYTHEDFARFETQGASVVDIRVVAKTATEFDLSISGYGTTPELTVAPAN